jgi:hypothetical protein
VINNPTQRRAWEIGGVGLVTLVGAFLRFIDIGAAPGFTDNADDIQFSWAGLNLIEHGDAYTWSYFTAYPQPPGVLQAYGTAFPMVHHWLDHPPLFALLMGAYLWLIGDRSMLGLTPEHVRALPAALSVLCIPLVYALGRRAVGAWGAFGGAVLLATVPAAVLMGREAEPESVLAPMLLLALLLAARQSGGSAARWQVVVLLALSLLAPLLKVTGFAIGGAVGVILLMNGCTRLAVGCVVAAALGIGIYVAYGWAVDWQLFTHVIQQQSQNRRGLLAGLALIADPAGINRPLHDGWWILGWIGLGLLLFRGRRSRAEQLVAWPAFAYALTVMVLAGEILAGQYGWYKVILQPLVYLAAGALAWRAAVSPSPARMAAVAVLGGATAFNWSLGSGGSGVVPNPVVAAALLAVAVLPSAVVTWPRFSQHAGTARGLAIAVMALLVLGNVVTSLNVSDYLAHF